MEWNGASDKYFTTSDKGYTVCITFHSGEKKYTAWAPNAKADTLPIDVFTTLAAAQKACEEHFNGLKNE